jgi:hypothetical protein
VRPIVRAVLRLMPSCTFVACSTGSSLDGPTMFARIGVMRALNRHIERVFDPSRKALANTIIVRPVNDLFLSTAIELGFLRRCKAASVDGLFHDSLDNGPRGAWSDPPVR